MGKKIELDETYVVNEYLKGKSSPRENHIL